MDTPEVEWTAAKAFRTPQFITLALAHFGCCAAHSGPIFHMVSYAMVCGIAPMTAVTVYSLAGLAGLGGRLALGVMADRIGAKPVLVGGLFVQALCVATYLAVGQLGEFYALSVVFGLAYGGVMPLYAMLVREFFGAKIMGTVFGAVSAVASLGMALGPWAGGWVFDTFHGYGWLYHRLVRHRFGGGRGGLEFSVAASPVKTLARTGARGGLSSTVPACLIRRGGWATIAFPANQKPKNARKRVNKLPSFDLVERARALQPLIAREADEIERTRRLTPPVVAALIDNGLYRSLLPQSLGGAEAPLEIFMQMQEEVAKADASHGVVPRPVQRLRDDGGLSRSGAGERDLQYAARHPGLGRDRP